MNAEISYFSLIFVRYTLVLLLSVNIIGNSFVVIIFLKKKKTMARQFSDLLLSNLAIADLLLGIVVLTCSLAFNFFGTVINDFYCKATGGVVYLSCGVSVYTLTVIAMERYGAVLKPARARIRRHDMERNRRILQIIWFITLIVVSPILVFLKKLDVSGDTVDCGFVQDEIMARLGRIYDAVVVLILFLGPNCFICCLYGRLVFKLWYDSQINHKPRLALMNSRCKLTKVSFVISAVFTICWTPYYFRTLFTLVLGQQMLVLSLVVCRVLVVVNSCANPIIYSLQCPRFRNHLRRLLDCTTKISPRVP